MPPEIFDAKARPENLLNSIYFVPVLVGVRMRTSVLVYCIASTVFGGLGAYEFNTARQERARQATATEDDRRRLAQLESVGNPNQQRPVAQQSSDGTGIASNRGELTGLIRDAVEKEVKAAQARAATQPSASSTTRSRPQPTVEEIRDSLETRFYAEKSDAQWVRDAERSARDKFSAALSDDSRVVSVECRSSLCRVETTHADVAHYREFLNASRNPLEWDGPTMTTVLRNNADGSLVSVAYLGRRGGEPLVQEDVSP